MSAIDFAAATEAALYSKLAGATALTSLLAGGTASPSVYPDPAPAGADTPYVVYSESSGSVPVRVMGGVAYENALYLVKAVDQSRDQMRAGTIKKQIDAALDGPDLTIAGHNHMRCSREQNVSYRELLPGGELVQHRGALYRVQASPTS